MNMGIRTLTSCTYYKTCTYTVSVETRTQRKTACGTFFCAAGSYVSVSGSHRYFVKVVVKSEGDGEEKLHLTHYLTIV